MRRRWRWLICSRRGKSLPNHIGCEQVLMNVCRDEAMMQSRRLQAEYLKEREKVQQLMLQPDTF